MPSYAPQDRPQNFGQQQPMQPQQAPQKQPQKPRETPGWAKWVGGLLIGLAVGGTIGTMGSVNEAADVSSATSKPIATVTAPGATTTVTAPPAEPAVAETPAAPETTEPAAPAYGTPKPADFKLGVKTLKKSCFGSAGCNITYRITVSYNGPALDPATEYTVTYAVKGGEDPQSNTFTVSGTEYTYSEQEFISTPRSSSKVTAVVTDIF